MATVNSTRKQVQLPLPIEGDIAEIPLTQGYMTIVDARDADLAQHKWYPVRAVNYARGGAILVERSAGGKKNRRTFYLHRIVIERVIGRPLNKGEWVDHINLDTLDNRRSNLRVATPSQNGGNQRTPKTNSSGYKGVSWHKEKQKWRASIIMNGRQKHLGYFDDPELAHEAYCKAATEYYGEFARFE